MALTFNGTQSAISSNLVPTGASLPSVTEIAVTDATWKIKKTFTIAKSAVEDATAATTFANVFDEAAVGLDKQVQDLLEGDLDDGVKTIEAHADLLKIVTNQQPSASGDFWTDAAVAYSCEVMIYANVS